MPQKHKMRKIGQLKFGASFFLSHPVLANNVVLAKRDPQYALNDAYCRCMHLLAACCICLLCNMVKVLSVRQVT